MVITGDKVLRMYNRSLDYFPKKDQYKTVISSNRLIKKFQKFRRIRSTGWTSYPTEF